MHSVSKTFQFVSFYLGSALFSPQALLSLACHILANSVRTPRLNKARQAGRGFSESCQVDCDVLSGVCREKRWGGRGKERKEGKRKSVGRGAKSTSGRVTASQGHQAKRDWLKSHSEAERHLPPSLLPLSLSLPPSLALRVISSKDFQLGCWVAAYQKPDKSMRGLVIASLLSSQ